MSFPFVAVAGMSSTHYSFFAIGCAGVKVSLTVFILFNILHRSNADTFQRCLQLRTSEQPLLQQNDSRQTLEELLVLSCFDVRPNKRVTVFEAEISLEEERIHCSSRMAFSFVLGAVTDLSVQQVQKSTFQQSCNEAFCVLVVYTDNIFFFSTPQALGFNISSAQTVTALGTIVSFDPTENVSAYAKRVASLFTLGVSDELALRRRLFLTSGEGMCSFADSLKTTLDTGCGRVEISILR